jgi:cysteine-rich repeat protein
MRRPCEVLGVVLLLLGCGTSGEVVLQDGVSPVDVKASDGGADLRQLDASIDTLMLPETAEADIAVPDEWNSCEPGSGCFGESCVGAEDCQSGLCLDHMGDLVCSDYCIEECPAGFSCEQLSGTGTDLVFACVSPFSHLCRPCHNGGDCEGSGGSEAACVEYDGEGWFCGADCAEHEECPAGFSCLESNIGTGQISLQCVAQAGVCECSDKAITLGLTTACEAANEFGVCQGQRACTELGLSECDAQTPTTDLCDGLDNDCDGIADGDTCDDGNSCTEDSCAGEAGCLNEAMQQGTCDDLNPCTVTDHCSGGECIGTEVACDDGNPCTDDVCDGESGCQFPLNQGPCDDGDPCTVADFCKEGECAGTPVGSCDDGNPCTNDGCDPAVGCVHAAIAGSCDDGNACTTGETCADGTCKATAFLNCNDGNVCTDDFCDPADGCLNEPNTAPCSDNSLCTQNDTCAGGICVAGKEISCSDSNPCTNDTCLPLVGCAHTNNAEDCDDSDPCTVGDTCSGGNCIGISQADCDDDNACTNDFCTPMVGCDHSPNAAACDDGDVCTVGDKCAAGQCQPGAPLICDDSNICTYDSCTPIKGCLFAPNEIACDDKNSCTTDDICTNGSCQGNGSLDCDDGNPCTVDICLPQGGCSHVPAVGECSDGNPCTVGDVCEGGQCQPGAPLECVDSNPCTEDGCGDKGCVYTPISDVPCDDGNECTSSSTCQEGLCEGIGTLKCDDDNICTTDYCDPSQGCVHALNDAPCDDGDICTLADACSLGECIGSQTLSCDDNNPCTDDSCAPETGCQFTPNSADCDDGLVCTVSDQCQAGTCVGGGFLNCADENPCTDDYCDFQLGCVNIDNLGACDDSNACTEGDSCSDGTCSGTPVDCDDDNVCSDDSCDTDTGCVNIANAVACNDGNSCTEDDVCADKSCGGQAIVCNDGEICTDDSCDPDSGCVYEMVVPCCGNGQVDPGEECDDGNHQSGDNCSADCESEKFVFQNSQTIDGLGVTCSSTTNNASYTQCDNLKAGGQYFPNGITCGPTWSGSNSSYSDTQGFCQSLTGSAQFQVYYNCTSSVPRATWFNHVWGHKNDNGYTQHVRCYY